MGLGKDFLDVAKELAKSGKPISAKSHARNMKVIQQDPFAAVDNISLWDGADDPLREYYRKEREKWRLKNKPKWDEQRRQKEKAEADAKAAFIDGSSHVFDWPREKNYGRSYHINNENEVRLCVAESESTCHFRNNGHFNINSEQFRFFQDNMGLSYGETLVFFGKVFSEKQSEDLEKVEECYLDSQDSIRAGLNNQDQVEDPHVLKFGKIIDIEGMPDVMVARRIGNTREMPWQDHAYWEIYTSESRIISDSFDDDVIVKLFIEKYVLPFSKFELTDEDRVEVVDELTYQIKNVIQYAESRAKGSSAGPSNYTVADLYFEDAATVDGRINYQTSGFNEDFINHPAVGKKAPTPLDNGVEIFNNEFGDGAGSWTATKIQAGQWRLQITGSRGESYSVTSSNIDELEDFFLSKGSGVYSGDKVRKELSQGAKLEDMHQSNDASSQVITQANFLRKIVEADDAISLRVASEQESNRHMEAYGPSDSKTMDNILGLYE